MFLFSIPLSEQEINSYTNCPPSGTENGLVGYWNFEEGNGNTVNDLTNNSNNGIINGATYSNDIPEQSCQLTTTNGCDSVAILNLVINNNSSSSEDVTVCDSFDWNGITYTESGVYTFESYQCSRM